MLRRPPTSIELKLEDIKDEYEAMRQQMAKEQEKQSKPFGELPSWQTGPRTKEEIYSRIGYVPEKPTQVQTRPNLL